MRIGIDARPLSKRRTGIGNYIQGLVGLLPIVAPQHDYFLYSNRRIDSVLPKGRVFGHVDGAFRWCPGSFWIVGRGAHMARRDALDVYWATDPILPVRMPPSVLKVVTVYDMVWLRCPETTTRYNLMVQTLCARRAIADADYVIVISQSTQDELIQTLRVPREKTRVVYPGVAKRYRVQEPKRAAEYISRKYGVPLRYMAFAGTVEPRKNLRLLVKALGILKSSNRLDCSLVVAGASGWKDSPLFRDIQAAGLTTADLRFLGYIPDEDMPLFYAGAQVFLFPSIYEGFGLPPIEAMACGSPVIASDSPCMPEVLGDAAILEPITSPERFASAISRVLADDQLRRVLREKGIQRSQSFVYETSVKQLLEIFTQPCRLTPAQLGQSRDVVELRVRT